MPVKIQKHSENYLTGYLKCNLALLMSVPLPFLAIICMQTKITSPRGLYLYYITIYNE